MCPASDKLANETNSLIVQNKTKIKEDVLLFVPFHREMCKHSIVMIFTPICYLVGTGKGIAHCDRTGFLANVTRGPLEMSLQPVCYS